MSDQVKELQDGADTESRYYGKYRALVTNNADPKQQLRVKCRIPSLLGGYESGWAMPCVPLLGNTEGLFKLPQVGDGLWIEFEHGDLNLPVYVGGWSNPSKVPVDTYKVADQVMQIQTRNGNKVKIDDTNHTITITTKSGTQVEVTNDSIVNVVGSLNVSGNLTVAKNTVVKGTTTSQGKLTVNDDAKITGNTLINGDTQIDGDSMIQGQLDVGKQIKAEGSITTQKNLFVEEGARVKGALNVYGKSSFTDNVNIKADELNVEAKSTFEGELIHKGEIDFQSTGNIILEGNVETTGDLRAEGTVRAGDLGFVTDGTLFVNGQTTLGGALYGTSARFSENVEAPNIP